MSRADDLMRSVGELREKGQGIPDAFGGGTSHILTATRQITDFFRNPDNLLALVVCAVAVIGIYRLLRSENIIPAPRRSQGGSLLVSFVARRLALRLLLFVVAAAIGLALASGHIISLVAALRRMF